MHCNKNKLAYEQLGSPKLQISHVLLFLCSKREIIKIIQQQKNNNNTKKKQIKNPTKDRDLYCVPRVLHKRCNPDTVSYSTERGLLQNILV